MKKKLLITTLLLTFVALATFQINNPSVVETDIEDIRAKHDQAIKNSPYRQNKHLSRSERKAQGLPPNAWNEMMWEMTMDPYEGRPTPERLVEVQKRLWQERPAATRGVGGDASNPWIDRGPNNVGGRTRGIMFDPTDSNNQRVYAGGVSGGLWVNNNITSAASTWTLVNTFPANVSVTVIISDPNNSNHWYIGSGESYTSGAAVGRGIWRSTDAGVTWTNVFGGWTSTNINANPSSDFVNGVFYINDIVARDVGATTEFFASVAGAFNSPTVTNTNSGDNQFLGLNEQNLYKSTDGVNWTSLGITEGSGSPINPNDIELDINNNVWFTTTRSSWGVNGGKIYQSTDGTTFNLINTIPNARRTELEPSATNANTFWVAADVGGQADLFTTTDAFTSFTQITTEPVSSDPGIPPTDYTRGQAFYDLPIESDASGNLIVGGIDLFRSVDNGANWTQISEWYNQAGIRPFVHADHHAIVQRPGAGNENSYVFATDGGLWYTADVTLAAGSSTNITSRNLDYNTVQFYYGTIDPVDGGDGDDLIGGTQDNGTQFVVDATAGANSFFDPVGGDGGYTEIDDTGLYMIQSYTGNFHRLINYPTITAATQVSSNVGGEGDFINQAELDKNLDILYSNSSFFSGGWTFQIERSSGLVSGPITRTDISDPLMTDSPSAMKVSPFTTGSTKLFVGLKNSRLLRVDNADTAPVWNNITPPGMLGSVSDIEFGQSENEIFVTMHNYGVTSIWYTSDGGTNWVSKEGDLPDIPVKCILQNPLIPQEVIVGTDLGVWVCADITAASPSWTQSYNGMSDVTVLDLDLRPVDNVILASTHGRGMFTSQFTNSALSITENNFDDSSVRIFPTVSNGEFTLKAKRNLGQIEMTIYDLNGRKVYAEEFLMDVHLKSFNLDLQGGLYLVQLNSENSKVTKRIIIQ